MISKFSSDRSSSSFSPDTILTTAVPTLSKFSAVTGCYKAYYKRE
jgi:hypothetical protein